MCLPNYTTDRRNINPGWNNLGFRRIPDGITNAASVVASMAESGITVLDMAEWTGSTWKIYHPPLPLNNFTLQRNTGYMLRAAGLGIWEYQTDLCP